MTHKQHPERRRSRRVKIGQPIKVRPSDPKDDHFEELSKTRNASRTGVYFVTKRESYYPGMRLFVTAPYYSPTDPTNCEYIAQVVRVENLGDGQYGVAAQLLSTVDLKMTPGLAGMQRR